MVNKKYPRFLLKVEVYIGHIFTFEVKNLHEAYAVIDRNFKDKKFHVLIERNPETAGMISQWETLDLHGD
jgi:hypothetical protein